MLPIPGKSLYVHFTVIIFTPSKDGLLKSNHHATQLPLKLANNIYDISISYSYICKSNNNVCIKTIRIIYLPFTQCSTKKQKDRNNFAVFLLVSAPEAPFTYFVPCQYWSHAIWPLQQIKTHLFARLCIYSKKMYK